ncbi:MAG: hypothetical protein ACK5MW_03040 [Enterococcus sp.]
MNVIAIELPNSLPVNIESLTQRILAEQPEMICLANVHQIDANVAILSEEFCLMEEAMLPNEENVAYQLSENLALADCEYYWMWFDAAGWAVFAKAPLVAEKLLVDEQLCLSIITELKGTLTQVLCSEQQLPTTTMAELSQQAATKDRELLIINEFKN